MLHFPTLVRSLEHDFGSFGGPFWEQKSVILAIWEALGTQTGPNPEKHTKNSERSFILELMFASMFNDVSFYFSARFLNHFWINVGVSLGPNLEPKISTNSIQKSFEILVGFLIGSWTFFWLILTGKF